MARRFLNTAPAAATGGNSGGDAAPPAPLIQWNLHGPAVKVAIAGNIILAALFFAAVIWRIFFSGRGQGDAAAVAPQAAQGAGGAAAAVQASSSAANTPHASPRAVGLWKDVLLSLPVYVHGSSPEDGGAGGEGKVEVAECAVCIGEIRDGDTVRILPRCGHRFHAECVDRWFRSHVTCPLCRAVVADGGAGKSCPKMQLTV